MTTTNYFKVANTGPRAGRTASGSPTKPGKDWRDDAFFFFDDRSVADTRRAFAAACAAQRETSYRASLSCWREPECGGPAGALSVPVIGEWASGLEEVAAE